MKNNIKTYNLKEKFSNIIKSESFVSLISSLISIIMGLLIGFIILLISNPTFAVQGFFSILSGGFSGGLKGIGDVLYFATPIILTGLSVGFAFKTGLFNIGASGQFLVGAFFAIYVGIVWTWLPSGLHWLVALLAAILGGAIWGMIPGLLKAYFNVNEVITSIMLNYIGLYLVNMIIERSDKIFDVTKNQTKLPSSEAILPKLGLNKIFNNSPVNAGIIIAIIFAIIMYIILSKTTFGYELKACGFNRFASKYAGINEKRNIILSMVIAGALAGIGGGLLYLAGSGKYIEVVDVLPSEGFDGIPVALLGLSNPIAIIFSGLFIAYIRQGGFYMQLYNFVPEIIDIIIAIIIYSSAFSLIIKLFIDKKKRAKIISNEMLLNENKEEKK